MNISEAVRVFKATQPALDAIAETRKQNERARQVLKAYMRKRGLIEHRGILMSEQMVSSWDSDALRDELGDRAEKFRRLLPRYHFRLADRRRRRDAA